MGRPKKSVSTTPKKDNSVEKLKKENENLKKQLSTLNNDLKAQLQQLINENKELHQKLNKKKKETFVGIKSVTNSNVWLPSPESRSGDPSARNSGRMLKPGKAMIVPSYWVVDWVTSNFLGLKMGDVVIDNEYAKKISPNVELVDVDIPEDFFLFEYNAEQIKNMAVNNTKLLAAFINKNKKNRLLLNQIRGILTGELNKHKENSDIYMDINNLLNRINSYISEE